MDKQNYYVEIM